jgi:hypothetical protein
LRKIEFRDNYNYNTTEGDYSHNYFFSLCPNLLSISGTKLFDFIDNNVLLLPKITEIKYLIVCKEIKSMDVLVDNCRHSLKRLGIKFIDRKFDETERIALMKHISSFANLEKLYLNFNLTDECIEAFINNMKIISTKCVKISHLDIITSYGNQTLITQMVDKIGLFTQLKSLKLVLRLDMSFKSLENCKQLITLYLTIEAKNDDVFEGIDLYLPQLTRLNVATDGKMSDNSLIPLNKLKNLKVLEIIYKMLICEMKSITDKGICHIINGCPQIKAILFQRTEISYKTIDALIAMALKRPRTQFFCWFGLIKKENMHSKHRIYKNKEDLPKNLIIDIDWMPNWQKKYFK